MDRLFDPSFRTVHPSRPPGWEDLVKLKALAEVLADFWHNHFNVVGGLHGAFPGLAPNQLFEGVDLEVTTDYRQVLSEVLIKRLGNRCIGEIFPGYTGYEALGVV